MSASGRTHADQLDGASSFWRSSPSSYAAFLYLIRTWPTERSLTAQQLYAVVDPVVAMDDQAAALTELSMMEFNATTTAFGADVPGKGASAWISRHRVSSSSMSGSLPDPSEKTDVLTVHGSGRPRGEPGTA
jgi:hypothetical protein